MKTPKRPVRLMTLAQIVCIAVMACTLLLLVPVIGLGVMMLWLALSMQAFSWRLLAELLCASALTGLLVWAEAEACYICGRVKKASAFSAANVKALGRIALALFLAGISCLPTGDLVIPQLLSGLPRVHPVVERALLPFMLVTVAAMIRAVQLLMRRALALQEENDLTV